MQTKFPEKLIALRKHYGYSQQDVASDSGVELMEYMSWENGGALPSLEQLQHLSQLFKVSLDDLMVNSADIVIPEKHVEQSIEIPFIDNTRRNAEEGVPVRIVPNSQGEVVAEPIEEDTPVGEPIAHTLETPVAEVAHQQEEELKERTRAERVVRKETVQTKTKSTQDKKKIFTLVGIVAGLVLVACLGVFLINRFGKSGGDLDLTMSNDTRLAAGDNFTLYLNGDGTVTVRGNGVSFPDVKEGVQVSAKSDFGVVLLKSGKVVASGTNTYGQTDVSEWTQIVEVSAGDTHTVGVHQDGTVVCAGDNSKGACDVADWKNVVDVEAGNGYTLGITSEGKVLVAGTIPNQSPLAALTNVSKIAIGDSDILILKKDGTVTCMAYSGTSARDVSTWAGIKQIAVGSSYAAGLTSSGTVVISSIDEQLKEEVTAWTNVTMLAGASKYLTAIRADGTMAGSGDNTWNQYVNESSSQGEEKEKLPAVTKITYTINSKTVKFSWDKIADADYYLVEINTGTGYSIKSTEATLSVDQAKFTNGSQYTITVTACSSADADTNSEPYSSVFTFTAVETTATPTPTPTATTTPGFTITWKNWDGSILQETTIAQGATPGYSGAAPTRPTAGDGTIYTFTGWSPAVVAATTNATYVAQYSTTTPTPVPTHNVEIDCVNDSTGAPIIEPTYGCSVVESVEENAPYNFSQPDLTALGKTQAASPACTGTMGTTDVTCVFHYTD